MSAHGWHEATPEVRTRVFAHMREMAKQLGDMAEQRRQFAPVADHLAVLCIAESRAWLALAEELDQ